MRSPSSLHRSTTILGRSLSGHSNNIFHHAHSIPYSQWRSIRTNTQIAISGVTHSQRLREMSTSGNATPSRIQPARKFTAIPGSDVYLSHSAKTTAEQATSQKPPSVILIFGWMDAQLSHLHKYTEKYNAIYPSATQVLVRTHQKYFWKGEPARKASVFPVVKLLRDAGISDATPPQSSGLLVHTFSNGGALAQTCLARAISTGTSSHPALPAQAFVYDSLPGTISLRSMITAFTAPIRSAPLRALAKVVFGSVYILAKVYRHTIAPLLGQKDDPFMRLHRELNDERLLPQHVPRTYIYSDADELIPMESVEGHAKKAREAIVKSGGEEGLVKMEKFEGSPHVAHARKEPERYWETVVKTWERSF